MQRPDIITKTLFSELQTAFYKVKLLDDPGVTYFDANTTAIKICGKMVPIPRKQAIYSSEPLIYEFSGTRIRPKIWTQKSGIDDEDIIKDIIQEIAAAIKDWTGNEYNYCIVNLYRNGKDYIGPHSDSNVNLDQEAGIVGISFSDLDLSRKMVFKSKENKKSYEMQLENGKAFWIKFPTNNFYTHEIPKDSNTTRRISLTFRKLIISQ